MKNLTLLVRWLALAGGVVAVNVAPAQVVDVGGVAREFTVNHHTSGALVRLSDYAGKVVVLDFFAYWCGPCQTSSPVVERDIQQYYAGRGGNPAGVPVVVLSVSIDHSNRAATDTFIANAGLSHVVDDLRNEAWGQFDTGFIPTFVILNGLPNATGLRPWQVLYRQVGFPGAAALRQIIDTVRPAAPAITASAAQALLGGGCGADGTVRVRHTLSFAGAVTGLGWQTLLPEGWSFVSASGTLGEGRPVAGATSVLDWTWNTTPPSPVTFVCTLRAPVGETGSRALTSLATVRGGETPLQVLAQPEPLAINLAVRRHAADTDGDGRFSLFELTRVIELFNTRYGMQRTGCVAVRDDSEDGFAPEPTRAGTTAATLARHHTADTNRDGKLNLFELTRVIELFNTRNGTMRTGEYHAAAGTEDGFAPGP